MDLPDFLIPIPGTSFVSLDHDRNMTPTALREGTIILETSIRDLPEVQALGPDDVVLDAGAFIDTPLIFGQHGCKVIAYEPYPDAAEALRHNCANFPNIEVRQQALGDGRPLRPVGQNCENKGNAGCRMVSYGGEPSVRIDSLNLQKLTGAKLDCEGAEYWILEGMRETIARCKPWLLIEVYDVPLKIQGVTRDDIFRLLDEVGYTWRLAIGRIEDERCDILCTPQA